MRSSDDADMTTLMPEAFVLGTNQLEIVHDVYDFAQRNDLFESNSIVSGSNFYFEGTINDPNSQTLQYPLTIEFTDACRESTIVP